jgi:hypothetical protein
LASRASVTCTPFSFFFGPYPTRPIASSHSTNTNRQYAQFVNEKMGQRFFRFVNGNDLIPRLPLGIPSWYFSPIIKYLKVKLFNYFSFLIIVII